MAVLQTLIKSMNLPDRAVLIPALAILLCDSLFARTIHVPGDAGTIKEAVAVAADGDVILVHPGNYSESRITVSTGITITSEWSLHGDESKIEETVIDCNRDKLFIINADDVEISGFTLDHGDHTIELNARATVKNNIFNEHLDGVSVESKGGGYIGYNTFYNQGGVLDRYDDSIDLDIGEKGAADGHDIVVEYNEIHGNSDDGIEIRFMFPDDNGVRYDIRYNRIFSSGGNGIQLITYSGGRVDRDGRIHNGRSGKEFFIYRNLIEGSGNGAITCTPAGETGGSVKSGAPGMTEPVIISNNTLVNNKYGIIGGPTLAAVNNIVKGSTVAAFHHFFEGAKIDYNNVPDGKMYEGVPVSVQGANNTTADPLLSDAPEYNLTEGSPAIDAGVSSFTFNGTDIYDLFPFRYAGPAPDLGAYETADEGRD